VWLQRSLIIDRIVNQRYYNEPEIYRKIKNLYKIMDRQTSQKGATSKIGGMGEQKNKIKLHLRKKPS
jgi:hypothetical protein